MGITLLGVEDADFFISSRQTRLPLVGVDIPTASFFWTAPVLGAALYAYLHLFLIKLWESHASAQTADAEPTHHWLVNDFVLIRQGDPTARDRPLAWIASLITRLLVWFAGPLVLFYAWWRSMPAHNEWMTLFIVLCLGVTLYVGFTSWWSAEACLRPRRKPWGARWRRLAAAAVALLLVVSSWLRTEGGLDHYANRLFGPVDPGIARLIPALDTFTLTHEHWLAGIWLDYGETWNPLARTNLAGVEMVDLPEGWRTPETARAAFRVTWCGREGLSMAVCDHPPSADRPAPATLHADRTKWCAERESVPRNACLAQLDDLDRRFESAWREERDAALANLPKLDLSKSDLRSANAAQVSFVNADLSGARLEGANLSLSGLEGADLSQAKLLGVDLRNARLEGANLSEARLEGADLRWSRLEGAILEKARLEGANLSQARLEGANLSAASLEGANLSAAWLEGARLVYAGLERADLSRAWLKRADLSGARLIGAYLSEASLEGARLFTTDAREASILGANLRGADLSEANLQTVDFRRTDFRTSIWSPLFFSPVALFHDSDFRGVKGLTQNQLEASIGNMGTLLPEGPSDRGVAWYVWSCWEVPPQEFERIIDIVVGRYEALSDRAALRADFLCGPDNLRRKVGTPLALDAPYPEGHPLARQD